MNEKVIQKFYDSIIKNKNSECWEWNGFINPKTGLPIIRDFLTKYSARRISLQIIGKILNNNTQVLSLCKNKLCLNPDHLVCGDEARFWSKVQKLSEANSGCWIWTGGLNKYGYGKFTIINNSQKEYIGAHRYSFELRYSIYLSSATLVCHKCDTPACVNPDHLFIGSQQDNMADRTQKGRTCSKLNVEQVMEIRSLYCELPNYTKIGKIYNVSADAIRDIILGKRWKHIP